MSMQDPIMTLYVLLADHLCNNRPKRDLCVRMLTSILMDGSTVLPTDPIEDMFSFARRWLKVLEFEYTINEIDFFYNTLNALNIME